MALWLKMKVVNQRREEHDFGKRRQFLYGLNHEKAGRPEGAKSQRELQGQSTQVNTRAVYTGEESNLRKANLGLDYRLREQKLSK